MVGIQRVVPTIKTGDDTSQAVYPLASNVFLIPPLGKLEASGSDWTRTCTGEVFDNVTIVPELNESVMFFCSPVGKRMEPVGIMSSSSLKCPWL